ncbi:hypothetical protein H6P81_001170 [Aristolochia fimbriata]|uniref:Outer envelope membrane protein 7 n=1 Tax=Aristolochia fimbriata TaxID=158543 RepID=A0AAV7FA53_ARIFI|nr:hypothetical protein H6P81_001170 [Aristolochia fimbriata]
MAGGSRAQRARTNSLKSAVVVFGALAFGWLTIEIAFKPFLDRAREAMNKADPSRDPDEDEDGDAPLSFPKNDDSVVEAS